MVELLRFYRSRDFALARVIIRRFSPGFKTNESYVYARACREWNIGKVRKTREEAAAEGAGRTKRVAKRGREGEGVIAVESRPRGVRVARGTCKRVAGGSGGTVRAAETEGKGRQGEGHCFYQPTCDCRVLIYSR